MYKPEFELGAVIWDDLTESSATIVGIEIKHGKCQNVQYHGVIVGYWVDNAWLGGGRHPSEISSMKGGDVVDGNEEEGGQKEVLVNTTHAI